jgi:hypothetical protein
MHQIAEIKLDHRRRSGGHGVDNRRAANPDLTLDVEADKLFEARRRIVETTSHHGPTPCRGSFPGRPERALVRLLCQNANLMSLANFRGPP